jgi:hypothetical protein
MLDLSHNALFTFSQTNRCDTEHPVIMDQVFGAQMTHAKNKKKINSLKHRIKKLTLRVHATSGFKLVKLDVKKVDKITDAITHELFNLFSWNRVKTSLHASWKEYFHMMYELLVHDYNSDHTNNIIVALAVVEYHDILVAPEHILYGDPMYPIISSISHLFTELKSEHATVFNSLKDINDTLRSVQAQNTELQHIIIALKKEKTELEEDNAKYMHIMRWSAQ